MKAYTNVEIPYIKAAAEYFLGEKKFTALSRIKIENIIKVSWGLAHFVILVALLLSLIL